MFNTSIKILILIWGCASEILLACAVCGFGEEQTREAFIVTTGIMTVVPLTVIGSIVYYIYRKMAKQTQEKSL